MVRIALALLVLSSSSVLAQDEDPGEEEQSEEEQQAVPDLGDQQAQVHFQSGALHFERGDYERALPEFEAAYQLSPRPQLLFNLYITHQNLGNFRRATELLEQYLASNVVPDEERPMLTARLENIRRRAEESEAEEAERQRATDEREAELAQAAADAEAAAAAEPEHEHTGFAVRLMLGIGFTGASITFDCPLGPCRAMERELTVEANGLGTNARLMVGWAFFENLVFQLEIFGGTMVAGKVTVNGRDPELEQTVKYGATAIGLGATYYFMPLNLYISGSFGIALGDVEGSVPTDGRLGFGMGIVIGKEWWIGEDWGLGVALAYDLFLTGEETAMQDTTLAGQSIGVLGSLTFN